MARAKKDQDGHRPWCVFYATRVALVFAANERKAYVAFIEKAFPTRSGGHLARPTLDEVSIRPLRAEDAGWIDEFPTAEAAPFRAALKRAR